MVGRDDMTAADEKMYLQDDPSEKCGLQEICGKGYPGKNSHGEIVCFTGECKFDTRARGTAPVCDDTCVYKRFAANMENAAAHDAEVAARITAQLTAQHEQELRDAVEGARLKVLEGGGKP